MIVLVSAIHSDITVDVTYAPWQTEATYSSTSDPDDFRMTIIKRQSGNDISQSISYWRVMSSHIPQDHYLAIGRGLQHPREEQRT